MQGKPMIRLLMLIVSVVVATAADARLLRQRTEGTNRVCTYSRGTSPDVPRAFEVRIGLGEPCPQRRPLEEEGASTRVPSLALLAYERVMGEQRICVYRLGGNSYSFAMQRSRRCPITPHVLD